MPELVIAIPPPTNRQSVDANGEARLHVAVHIQADVLAQDVAERKANRWLFMNAGNLVRAEHPQLILDAQLLWRFNVCLTLPDLQNPGLGTVDIIGKLDLDAITGEAVVPTTFIQELQAHADAIAYN